jgi:hypothetical protein
VIPWLAFERRWRDSILAAMIPRLDSSGLPGLAELDLTGFHERFDLAAPPLLRFGIRAAVWFLIFAPPFLIGRFAPFSRLSAEDRDRVLDRASRHRLYLVRQLLLTLKLVASFAYFQDPRVRSAFE